MWPIKIPGIKHITTDTMNIFTSPLKKYKTVAMYNGNSERTLCKFEDGYYGIWDIPQDKWSEDEKTGYCIFSLKQMIALGWQGHLNASPIWVMAKVPAPVCDCGCDKTYGPRNTIHTEYCSKYPLTKKG